VSTYRWQREYIKGLPRNPLESRLKRTCTLSRGYERKGKEASFFAIGMREFREPEVQEKWGVRSKPKIDSLKLLGDEVSNGAECTREGRY